MTANTPSHHLMVRVSDMKLVAPTIKEFTLVAVDGALSPFSPGSHVVVTMSGTDANGKAKKWKNAYSLLSDPSDTEAYKIAVRLQEVSRGGSEFMHSQVQIGDVLEITPPANLFAPLWRAKKHLLIAGGVGITPFMSYLPEMQRQGANFELHYCYRGKQTGAYADQLQQQLGDACVRYDADAGNRCDLTALLKQQPRGTHIYICGPELLIEGVRQNAAQIGYPASLIHFEEFAAPQPGEPFSVTLKRSGQTIDIGAEESLLEALEAADLEIPNMCRGGVCGQCQTKVLEGDVEHRDNYLGAAEKADCIMPCVSRAKSKTLVLDL
ncbi:MULTISPECIES: PDR/VanB family oxidoreductase [unclassified Oceanobacter]|uniref:PDR/VanB family oxidoreductase n=1 Tax=unclassified Oceanobacter TaxID=2620260 RepID=UPI0027348BF1|nr:MULTISPECIES: PDR/VanB family oxidoreductase [unclassified Oceanobacter]MDP2505493.1 PDR/VanB family oxidoreductase [Oceanobacter sp. 3_MG-2023]MDP2548638.1 PDR/VanB family oxidoreductase [Oceanobacter sp. 4_MG-2023]